MSFDTTTNNIRVNIGACILHEKKIKINLSLASWHHTLKLTFKKVFNKCMGSSSGPIFRYFKEYKRTGTKLT